MKKINKEMEKWMKIGAATVGAILLGIVLMILIPSLTSGWSLLGPALLFVGTIAAYKVAVRYNKFDEYGYPIDWAKNNRVAIGWFISQPLILVSLWGFMGSQFSNLWILLPLFLVGYNFAGWVLYTVSEKGEWGLRWVKLIGFLAFVATIYIFGVNGYYAIYNQGINLDDAWRDPGPLGVLGFKQPPPKPKPAQPAPVSFGGAKAPKGAKSVSGDQIEVAQSTWSANTKDETIWVRLAPGDPLVIPFGLAPDAVIYFDNRNWWGRSSWKVGLQVEREGMVEEFGKADIRDLLLFGLCDPKTDKVFRNPVDNSPVGRRVKQGDSYSIKQLLGSLENYPQDRALQPRFAVNTNHPFFKGGEKLGGCIEFEFRCLGMSQ